MTSTQQETLSGDLANLTPELQALYSALGAHPEYGLLIVEADTKESTGTSIYRIRAQSDRGNDTFVRTVFSRGELNVVALALFLAVSRTTDNAFGVTILDDPSQSLDDGRERAVAAVLREVAHDRQVLVATEEPALVEELSKAAGSVIVRLVDRPYEGATVEPE